MHVAGSLNRFSKADLLSSTYKDNLTAFNKQFQKAREIFEGKLRLDEYQLVADTGKSRSHASDWCLDVHLLQPSMWPWINLV